MVTAAAVMAAVMVIVMVIPQPPRGIGAMMMPPPPPRPCHGAAVPSQRVGGGPLRRQASPLLPSASVLLAYKLGISVDLYRRGLLDAMPSPTSRPRLPGRDVEKEGVQLRVVRGVRERKEYGGGGSVSRCSVLDNSSHIHRAMNVKPFFLHRRTPGSFAGYVYAKRHGRPLREWGSVYMKHRRQLCKGGRDEGERWTKQQWWQWRPCKRRSEQTDRRLPL